MGFLTGLIRILVGFVLGFTFALVGEQLIGYTLFIFWIVVIFLLLIFLKFSQNWSLLEVSVFALACFVMGYILKAYLTIIS